MVTRATAHRGGNAVLRVTVTRESSTETKPIGEVVIGKFAGTEQRGGYAAWVHEPPLTLFRRN